MLQNIWHNHVNSLCRDRPSRGPANLKPTRNSLLDWMYKANWVQATPLSAHLSDKLFFYQWINLVAPQAIEFFAETRPVTENERWPTGDWLAKPTGGMDSGGSDLYHSEIQWKQAVQAGRESFFIDNFINPLTGLRSSGSKFCLQRKASRGQEYRVHSLGAFVVRGATFTRWDTTWDSNEFKNVEDFLQRALNRMPEEVLLGQAWSFDIIGSGDAGFSIIEVNTNRGKQGHWSGDLDLPDVLGAYFRHLESKGCLFLGAAASLFRQNRAGEEKFIEKHGIDLWVRHRALRHGLMYG